MTASSLSNTRRKPSVHSLPIEYGVGMPVRLTHSSFPPNTPHRSIDDRLYTQPALEQKSESITHAYYNTINRNRSPLGITGSDILTTLSTSRLRAVTAENEKRVTAYNYTKPLQLITQRAWEVFQKAHTAYKCFLMLLLHAKKRVYSIFWVNSPYDYFFKACKEDWLSHERKIQS
ncbi:hypothetical protein A359_08170 [secondary endosymbiont of Ctenarytaina eucalypti]|uniref:Uncharacterized protein n=1 Tax=secondary endosymbiont of Ctenarytaina eucalypti TaxID=1199245 RepID=J3YSF7_9ENTR|nr:hypothetical protein A359_08170 [secondary endosymbiont of Ctenarytaina eucalypti]